MVWFLILAKSSLGLSSWKCSCFWLTTYLLCLMDVFSTDSQTYMCTNSVPLLSYLFLDMYEAEFMQSIIFISYKPYTTVQRRHIYNNKNKMDINIYTTETWVWDRLESIILDRGVRQPREQNIRQGCETAKRTKY